MPSGPLLIVLCRFLTVAAGWRVAVLPDVQHRPGVPDQALALAGHRQPMIPPRILHDEERSCRGNDMVW